MLRTTPFKRHWLIPTLKQPRLPLVFWMLWASKASKEIWSKCTLQSAAWQSPLAMYGCLSQLDFIPLSSMNLCRQNSAPEFPPQTMGVDYIGVLGLCYAFTKPKAKNNSTNQWHQNYKKQIAFIPKNQVFKIPLAKSKGRLKSKRRGAGFWWLLTWFLDYKPYLIQTGILLVFDGSFGCCFGQHGFFFLRLWALRAKRRHTDSAMMSQAWLAGSECGGIGEFYSRLAVEPISNVFCSDPNPRFAKTSASFCLYAEEIALAHSRRFTTWKQSLRAISDCQTSILPPGQIPDFGLNPKQSFPDSPGKIHYYYRSPMSLKSLSIRSSVWVLRIYICSHRKQLFDLSGSSQVPGFHNSQPKAAKQAMPSSCLNEAVVSCSMQGGSLSDRRCFLRTSAKFSFTNMLWRKTKMPRVWHLHISQALQPGHKKHWCGKMPFSEFKTGLLQISRQCFQWPMLALPQPRKHENGAATSVSLETLKMNVRGWFLRGEFVEGRAVAKPQISIAEVKVRINCSRCYKMDQNATKVKVEHSNTSYDVIWLLAVCGKVSLRAIDEFRCSISAPSRTK